MLASEMVKRLEDLIRIAGDREVAVAGVFHGGIHKGVDVFDGSSQYHRGGAFLINDVNCEEYFIIDEEN